jgi:hypothetical protein
MIATGFYWFFIYFKIKQPATATGSLVAVGYVQSNFVFFL